MLVPGGFGTRGIEGKIMACKWARENNVPFLGRYDINIYTSNMFFFLFIVFYSFMTLCLVIGCTM